jgi:RNA 2',3'-cyclic 3'-phosphodiesterase
MKRLFCAVKVPHTEAIGAALDAYQQALHGESIKWVEPFNLHLTLKFFGDTPNRETDNIIPALHKAAAACPPFSFQVQGCGTFGSPRLPRVIWLGIKNAKPLSDLYHEVNHQLEPLGYVPDKKIFTPHLTIARIKHLRNPHALTKVESELMESVFSQVTVNHFYLMESVLRREGPLYKVVEEFELGEGHRA